MYQQSCFKVVTSKTPILQLYKTLRLGNKICFTKVNILNPNRILRWIKICKYLIPAIFIFFVTARIIIAKELSTLTFTYNVTLLYIKYGSCESFLLSLQRPAIISKHPSTSLALVSLSRDRYVFVETPPHSSLTVPRLPEKKSRWESRKWILWDILHPINIF